MDLTKPLDTADAETAVFLESVQGNILKGHGRDHTAHIFVTFADDSSANRTWAAELAASHITSASEQFAQVARWKARDGGGEPFVQLLLAATGYSALGADETPDDVLFRAGLKRHNEVSTDPFNDPPPAAWEPGFADQVDAMVLIAHDSPADLEGRLQDHLARLSAIGAQTFVERGDKLTFDFGAPRGVLEIEHFGHQDGVSNPRMTRAEVEEERTRRGASHWDPAAGADLVFVKEPGGGYGSYMVFRKLEQNVAAFDAACDGLGQALGVSALIASALIVGRHRDGTALIDTETPDSTADPNDFNYAGDSPAAGVAGRLCPFHSHIRRSNPRGDIARYLGQPDDAFERSMRIARRGITYGARSDLKGEGQAPQSGVGLLFMSFQASLRQFAIQQAGSDSADFPFGGAGLEGLTGRPAAGETVAPQAWPDPDDPTATRPYRVVDFVTLKGGEYLFAPSLTFLRALGGAGVAA